jgi:hypothetical protein
MKRTQGTENFRAKGQAPWEAMRLNAESNQPAGEGGMGRLEEVFAQVCKTFFPRWNRDARWRVSSCLDGGPNHRIARGSKTILLSVNPEDDAELHCLLIHEICHAITRTRHDKKWLHRMKQAVDKALAIGREDLAELILREVESYARAGTRLKMMSDLVYYSIEDCVFANPSLSCDEVLESVAFKWGFSPTELERNWRRCRQVYEDAASRYSSW